MARFPILPGRRNHVKPTAINGKHPYMLAEVFGFAVR